MKSLKTALSVILASCVFIVGTFSVPVQAADCMRHQFSTRYLAVVCSWSSSHNVWYEGKTRICTIQTTTHAVVDYCKKCEYQAGSYFITSDSHSAPHP